MIKFFCIFILCFLSLVFTDNALGKYWLEVYCLAGSSYSTQPIDSSSYKVEIWSHLYRHSKKSKQFLESRIFLLKNGYPSIKIGIGNIDWKESRKRGIELVGKCIDKHALGKPAMFEISEDLYNKLLECHKIVKGRNEYSISDRQQAFYYYFNTVINLLDTIWFF